MDQRLYTFYRLLYFLTARRRLVWKFENKVTISSNITNELTLSLTYYENGKGSDVFDFEMVYSYFDINHELIKKTLSQRLRESDSIFTLLGCKEFYESAKYQANNYGRSGTAEDWRLTIETYEILNEYASVFQLKGSGIDNPPFDEQLFIKILKYTGK